MEKLHAKDYRKIAHETTRPYSGILAAIYLIYTLLIGATGCTGIGAIILSGPLYLGFVRIIRGTFVKKDPKVEDLFGGFNDFAKSFVCLLLQSIFVSLWSLLFVIPGIIANYRYAMAFYVMDDENLSGYDAITRSKELMKGHKWELFCLDFSYIGWAILCALTFGILTFWVQPRIEAAHYAFYQNLVGKKETVVD